MTTGDQRVLTLLRIRLGRHGDAFITQAEYDKQYSDAKEYPWWHDWATVEFKPSFWWRLKYLFFPHHLTFCWGNDKWFSVGFKGEYFFSFGGVPLDQRDRKGMS